MAKRKVRQQRRFWEWQWVYPEHGPRYMMPTWQVKRNGR